VMKQVADSMMPENSLTKTDMASIMNVHRAFGAPLIGSSLCNA